MGGGKAFSFTTSVIFTDCLGERGAGRRLIKQHACVLLVAASDAAAQHARVEGRRPVSVVGERLQKPGEGTWTVTW